MGYLPFARKYRPQTFDELVGQPHVTKTLKSALESKRIAQAYLFAGSRGVGKTSAARILAKCLNCAKGPTATPCNTCASCVHITCGNSLDVIEIDGASNRGIDEIRALRDTIPYAPTSGPFRIYIIDEVHMLTTEAFNALLKTLEEPPAHVKFIFATTASNKVPSTILSRCQRFDFRRLEAQTIVQALKPIANSERVQADEPALYAIARAAEGSLRDAEVSLEQVASFVEGPIGEAEVISLLGAIASEALMALTQAIVDHNPAQALSVLLQQREQGKDAPQLLSGLLLHLRNLLILRSTMESPGRDALMARLIDEPSERLKRLNTQAQQLSPGELLLCVQIVTGAYELVRRSPMAQTILELVVIKLATREQWQSLEQISQRLEQLGSAQAPERPMRGPSQSSSATRTQPTTAPATSVQADAPEAVQMTALEEFVRLWPEFLEKLGKCKMSLAAYLTEAKPLQIDGGALTIGLPGFSLHQEVLSLAENKRLIDRLLGELSHQLILVRYTTLTEPAQSSAATPAAAPAVPPVVEDIVQLFNATILDQPRTI
jgi:DNA polymerase-3 subunit gamma/tau